MKIRALVPPLMLIAAVGILWIAQNFGLLPKTNVLLDYVSNEVIVGGVVAIAVVAMLENIVGLNTYFPGAVVILGVMAATYGDPAAGFKTFLAIVTGQISGLSVSRLIGLRAMNSPDDLEHRASWTSLLLLVAFWHPHSAAATAFALGSRHHPRGQAIVLVGCLIWSVFWALVMYFGVGSFIKEVGWDYITIGVAVIWLALELFQGIRKSA